MEYRNRSRFARLLVTALAALAVTAPTANAAKTAAAAEAACAPRAFSTVFAAWGDNALYTLVPGGDFEPGGTAWKLTGGEVAPGSSGFAAGASALSLPAGASALSPPICVEKNYPTWRFAATSAGGSVRVQVLYPKKAKDSGTVTPAAAWGLTPVLRFSTGQFKGAASIQVRLTAVGRPVRVDDVYLDPRIRG